MRKSGVVIPAVLTICVLVSACARTDIRQSEIRPADGEHHHCVHDVRLRSAMRELNREVSTSWPQEIEDEYATSSSARTGKALEEACWLSDGLTKSAEKISGLTSDLDLSDRDQVEFSKLAALLGTQAQRLEKVACGRDIDRVRRVLTSIRSTCRMCHERFHHVTGPLRH